ncbi:MULTISPECIES: hypothetical protein [Thiothrix]|jgi:hypothetical protein|uniref:Uncharacterized protein n=1 Tax=Thiothrix unzii TaxID=111769 RepID=A0A975F7Z2_9GAMM|nr:MULTISPECIES: hypothetical protein [Thiothrix]MDX9987743.1 hypothetical protein [Thiothrix unzii]QTR52862.1 hypothetical protein J9260_14300 [Thiothrix unzii]
MMRRTQWAAYGLAGILLVTTSHGVAASKLANQGNNFGDTSTESTGTYTQNPVFPYIEATAQVSTYLRNYLLQYERYIKLESLIKTLWLKRQEAKR